MKQRLRPMGTPLVLLLVFVCSGLTEAADNGIADASNNHLFDVQNIEGWTVYVNKKDLADHAGEMKAALKHLQQQLYHVRMNVPAPAVAIMQQRVPLWFEYDTLGIAYHHRSWLVDNGYRPPDVENLIGFCRARTFLGGALHQPSVVFHELAHGYDYLYLRRLNPGRQSLLATAGEASPAIGVVAAILWLLFLVVVMVGLCGTATSLARRFRADAGHGTFALAWLTISGISLLPIFGLLYLLWLVSGAIGGTLLALYTGRVATSPAASSTPAD